MWPVNRMNSFAAGWLYNRQPDAVAHSNTLSWDRARMRRLFSQKVDLALLVLCALVLVVFRLHAFDVPLERDEGNYAYIGSRLLAGDRLYVDVWDHQPPGVFVLFAAVAAVFGQEPEVFRWLAVIFSLVSMFLVYSVSRCVAGRPAGLLAAALFAVVSSDPSTAGEGCNREIYMNTLILAAWAAAFRVGVLEPRPDRSISRRSLSWLIASGAALALASSMKTIVAVHWLVLAAWCIGRCLRCDSRAGRVRDAFRIIAALGLAPAVLWVGIALRFAADGRLPDFVDAVLRFNLDYASSSAGFFRRFADFFTPPSRLQIFSGAAVLWIASGFAFVGLLLDAMLFRRRETWPALLLLGSSYVAVCLPNQFWPHYYYLLMPAMVAAAAALVARLGAMHFAIGPALAFGLLGGLLATQHRVYLSQPPQGITDQRYSGRDFWARGQAEQVARVTDPADLIFVYGNDASIYYYADRKSASRYTMIGALHPRYPGYDRRRKIMLDEIIARRPRLILVILGEPAFPEWIEFLPTRYDAVGYDLRDTAPNDPVMMVLCDRERPIGQFDWDWRPGNLAQ
jgi:hypothetical protein